MDGPLSGKNALLQNKVAIRRFVWWFVSNKPICLMNGYLVVIKNSSWFTVYPEN